MLVFPHEYKDVNKISVSESRNTRALSRLLRELELPLVTLLDPCMISEEHADCVNLTTALLFMYRMGDKDLVVYIQCNSLYLTVVCVSNSVLNFLGTQLFTA